MKPKKKRLLTMLMSKAIASRKKISTVFAVILTVALLVPQIALAYSPTYGRNGNTESSNMPIYHITPEIAGEYWDDILEASLDEDELEGNAYAYERVDGESDEGDGQTTRFDFMYVDLYTAFGGGDRSVFSNYSRTNFIEKLVLRDKEEYKTKAVSKRYRATCQENSKNPPLSRKPGTYTATKEVNGGVYTWTVLMTFDDQSAAPQSVGFKVTYNIYERSIKKSSNSDGTKLINAFPKVYSLEGAEYTFRSTLTGKVAATFVTDKNGNVKIKSVTEPYKSVTVNGVDYLGNIGENETFYLKETKASKGFITGGEKGPIKVNGSTQRSIWNSSTTYNNGTDTISNLMETPYTGSINVDKTLQNGSKNNRSDLAGAELTLFYSQTAKPSLTINTINNGTQRAAYTTSPNTTKKVATFKVNAAGNVRVDSVEDFSFGAGSYTASYNDSTLSKLPVGYYTLVETKAPTGGKFELSAQSRYDIQIKAEGTNNKVYTFTVEEPDKTVGHVNISLLKEAEDPNLAVCSLEGAVYDVYYNASKDPTVTVGSSEQTDDGKWIQSVNVTNGTCVASFTTDADGIGLVSYLNNDLNTIDENAIDSSVLYGLSGHYAVVEVLAPKGYAPDTNVYKYTLDANDASAKTASVVSKESAPNDPIDLKIVKVPAGDTQLTPEEIEAIKPVDGTQFTLKFYEGQSDWTELKAAIDNKTIEADRVLVYEVVDGKVFFNNENLEDTSINYLISGDPYTNEAGGIIIPIGIYTIEETLATEGYSLADNIWTDKDGNSYTSGLVFRVSQHPTYPEDAITEIYKNGVWTEVSGTIGTEVTVKNPEDKGSFEFNKVVKYSDGTAPEGLANVKFTLYYLGTGEAAESITKKQDAIDASVHKFENIRTDAEGHYEMNNLPTGRYMLVEENCDENKGLVLAKPKFFTIENGKNYDKLATNPIANYQPHIGTLEWDKELSNDDYKSHMSNPDDDVKIVDTISYSNLAGNSTYTFKAVIMDIDGSNVSVLKTKDGEMVTAVKTITTAKGTVVSGEVDMEFASFSAEGLEGHKFVIYEFLFKGTDVSALIESDVEILTGKTEGTVAKAVIGRDNKAIGHYDPADENQIGYFPEVSTIESDITSLSHVSPIWEENGKEYVKVMDTLKYKNLDPSKTYTIKVSVRDYDSLSVIASSEVTFVPDVSGNGEKEVEDIVFEAKDYNKFYITEELYVGSVSDGLLAASHTAKVADQTGMIARIGTIAKASSENGKKEGDINLAWASKNVTLTDKLEYHNLNNEKYEIKCEYHYVGGAHDGEVVKDANGKSLTVTKKGKKLSDGTIDMVIEGLDLTNLQDETIVAYETLFWTNKAGQKIEIAREHKADNKSQSVKFVGLPVNFEKIDQKGNVVKGAELEIRKGSENGTVIKKFTSGSEAITIELADGTYYLVETKAPKNYALASPVAFEVREGKLYVGEEEVKTATVTMVDMLLSMLPSTGGMGTVPFVLTGMILMLGAALIITRRKA